MFLGTEIQIALGFNVARARLADLARDGLLRDTSDDAWRDLDAGLARVGPLGAVPGMSKLVTVQFRDTALHQNFAVWAIRWEATGPGGVLFPALDADIMLTQMGEDATMLAVWGVYRPPLGALGAGLDRVVMRRVAEATIRTFAHRIGAAITDLAASPAPGNFSPLPDIPPRPEPEEL
jgi:hypothetical protein